MASRTDQPSSTSPVQQESWRNREYVLAAWFVVLFLASIGLANGDSNQNGYLLLGLRLADPGFLPGDWYTWDTLHSHQVYGHFVAVMARLGTLIPGLTLGTIVQNALFAFALLMVFRVLYERALLPWAASLALFSALGTTSLGDAAWLKPFLGVSALSAVAMTLGVAFASRGRTLATGLAMGCSALFHAHFLVLSLPLMLAISLADPDPARSPRRRKRIAELWGPYLFLGAPTLWLIIRFTTAPGIEEIEWLTGSVFPYHVAPWTWNRDPVLLLIGTVILGVGGLILRPPRRNRALLFSFVLLTLVVFGSLFLAYFRVIDLAARTWPWRLSPLLLVAGLSLGTAAITRPQTWRSLTRGRAELGLGLLIVGLVVIAGLSRPPVSYVLFLLAWLPVVQGAVRIGAERGWPLRGNPNPAAILLVSLSFVPLLPRALESSHVDFRPERAERAGLYQWVRSETPHDAVFAIPPSWEGFRINALRPIVADWKAIPRYPPDRLEWLRRMQALTGLERPGYDRSELDAAYSEMDCERALRLRREYRTRYVVLNGPGSLDCGGLVYEDQWFRVWDLSIEPEVSGLGGSGS